MLKVLTGKVMAERERLALHGGNEELFMENAGRGVAEAVSIFSRQSNAEKSVVLLAGKGNNGGDGFVAACYLLEEGFDVQAVLPEDFSSCSPLCRKNAQRFQAQGGMILADCKNLRSAGIILDGIFGTGFKGAVQGSYREMIEWANGSRLPILAIDIPSGLDSETGQVETVAVKAAQTLFLELPKQGFFLQKGWDHIGKLVQVPFGIDSRFFDDAAAKMVLGSLQDAAVLLPAVLPSRHKYSRGSVAGLAGSVQFPGAASLTSFAALRAGAGIVKLAHPADMESSLAGSHPEVIQLAYRPRETEKVLELLVAASACFLGPGIGQSAETVALVKEVLKRIQKPLVIDADALTMIAAHDLAPPGGSVLTPHRGEMNRLLKVEGKPLLDLHYLELCQGYADRFQVTIVLKGAPTFLIAPKKTITLSVFGSPAMATAGSGDVLTGILAALLAQGLSPTEAAQLGCALHGLAGESAAKKKTLYCVVASDILEELPQAFQILISA